MSSLWQQLGAFVADIESVGGNKEKFAQAGGRWVAPVLIGDSRADKNLQLLDGFKRDAHAQLLSTLGWFNGWNEDTWDFAKRIEGIVKGHDLQGIILDLEVYYKTPYHDRMPLLLKQIRQLFPVGTLPIGVSSYGFLDRAMIWRDFRDLGIRYLPQWYYKYNERYSPDWCMQDLLKNGLTDTNITYAGRNIRGVPLSYVHGTLEVLEGHTLREGLDRLHQAKPPFSNGWSVYLLENCSDDDFSLMRQEQGRTYLL